MKKIIHKAKNTRVVRFAGVGVINTLLDFIILNAILKTLLIHPDQRSKVVIVNCISATIVSMVSFYLNRRYVFKTSHSAKSRYVRLLIVSLIGIFVIQASLIALALPLVKPLVTVVHGMISWFGLGSVFTKAFLTVNAAKAVGTLGSMSWNYIMYKKFVFNERGDQVKFSI